jgi:type II secretory pathway pseudopilin PulG
MHGKHGKRAGHTIIEVLVAFSFLIVGSFGFLSVIVSTSDASSMNHEVSLAKEAARVQIEELMDLDYKEVFARFNDSTADDPGGGVLSPGAHFDVTGLNARAGDLDGLAGEIIFPTSQANPTQVREDAIDQALGCPMDLNGDQVIDASDHAGDLLILPVVVRITWSGVSGNGTAQFKTILGAIQ